jgi:tRNA pseudouridine synthase 10
VLRVQGQAGLYIKELVSGDDGRTRPSLAELLGVPSKVSELDVIGVEEPPRPPAMAATGAQQSPSPR